MYFSAIERSPFCGGERNRGRRGHHGRQARRRVHPHEPSRHALRRVRPRDRRSGSVPQVRQRRLLFRGVQVREESDSEPPKLPATPAFTLSNQLDRKTSVLSKHLLFIRSAAALYNSHRYDCALRFAELFARNGVQGSNIMSQGRHSIVIWYLCLWSKRLHGYTC